MKKNISINLQGLIFHIEEDGYEVLQRYLQDVKAYFSTYRGHEEIVADIEGRIAEIFAARLSSTKQVITFDDVEAMVAKMGRVQDFQQDGQLDDDDDAADTASYGQPLGGGAYAGTSTATAPAPTVVEEPRRLYRDMSNRRVAGVAAGLARYFNINPLWVRLIFVGSLFSPIIGDFVGALPAISLLTYAVLWIALPKRYDDRPMPDDDVTRKLFRDTDSGSIGGVAAGLAAYMGIEVAILRIVFVLSIFLGGTGLLLYLILWMVVPPARTLSQKAQMRGEAVTLSGLEQSLRNQGTTPVSNRPVGAFIEELGRAIRPVARVLGTVVRVFVGLMFILTGFALLMGLLIVAGVAVGLLPESQNIQLGNGPAYAVLAGVPWWFVVSGFLAAGIPVLLLLSSGIGLLMRRWLLGRTPTLILLGLWMLGIVGSIAGGVRTSQEFQEEGSYTVNRTLGALPGNTVTLDARRLDYDWDMQPEIMFAAADSGNVIAFTQEVRAHGRTFEDATNTARNSIAYRAVLRDSSVVLDNRFSFRPGAIFRAQELDVTLRLPRNKQFRITPAFAHLLDDYNFLNDQRPDDASKHLYRLRGNQLECIDCTPTDFPQPDEDGEESYEGEFDSNGVRIDVDTDNDEVDIDVDLGDIDEFSTDPADYGDARRNYTERDFSKVEVNGAYHVVLRQGSEYKVHAYGTDRELNQLDVHRNGDELVVRPRRNNLFGNWRRTDGDEVLVEVTLPTLRNLELAGAVKAEASGFDDLGSLEVEQAGASHLRFNGNCNLLSLDLAGACKSSLSGRAEQLRIEGSGACQVQASEFPVNNAEVELTGVSKARLQVVRQLRADVSGASQVAYSGNPTNVRNNKSGASKITRVEE
ncbi:PspC domain-containing protein [Hymenobacter latericus]|uniref:PspC domain-containing protein n=1 Tax=Hymenobacter sp. YIM 151858-1 TaxID=2987688 RepID=UPI0022264992|nr:PspC domain-containing protein [Hymenobacter sp. YIM 151858-1]UYZ59626.1 PspC domain-containing protein [Hymenobacter sp. YIM 151858-1]